MAIATLAVVACGASESSGGNKPTIKIGLLADLSGQYKSYGTSNVNGAQLALEEINSAGGVNGSKLEIVSGDTVAKPDQALLRLKELEDKNVFAIIGPTTTLEANGIFPAANKDQVPIIAAGTSDPLLTEKNRPWTFRNYLGGVELGGSLGKLWVQRAKVTKIGIILESANPGVPPQVVAEIRGAKDAGATIVNEDKSKWLSFTNQQTDFSGQVSQLKSMGIDGVIVGGAAVQEAAIAREMKVQGLNIPALGGNGVPVPGFLSLAGDAGNNWYGVTAYFEGATPASQAFSDKYNARFGERPQDTSAAAYDDMKLIANALKTAGIDGNTSLEKARIAVKDKLQSVKDYDGITGVQSMGANGDMEKNGFLLVVQNGKFQLVK
jgi:branched-chain amino acid transport system substrate-binding protein